MKKEKKHMPKPKDFAATPFRSLKGFQADSPAPPTPAPTPVPPPVAEDDSDLFLRAVANVRRLQDEPARPRPQKPAVPPKVRIEAADRQAFLEAIEELRLDVNFRDELPDDVVPLKPLPVNRMRQLRRGALRIDYELDLHGMTRDEALESLTRFITGAFNRGQKAVLVITGKGNNSPDEPVLQGAVASWLRDRGKAMVAEFAPAPRQMGGNGAFVVFLREKDGNQGLGIRD
ncbi:Smr/MutS family protein [Geobacter sp. AOG1]|uniref:Smr/MutS family protein n=1 Tax=Geobacter sp. AOG1 TaxID=1566346 RepID=UPI001CC44468|nr:Smr/MutS family protein [Geobacter sp. AOG1]GFE57725.1 DNA mismatch repair protein MutS [Geobacter sp. AOG1]